MKHITIWLLVATLLTATSCNFEQTVALGSKENAVEVDVRNDPDSIHFPDRRFVKVYFPAKWYKLGPNHPIINYYMDGEKHEVKVSASDVQNAPSGRVNYYSTEIWLDVNDNKNIFFELGNDPCDCGQVKRVDECLNDQYGLLYNVTSNIAQTDSLVAINFDHGMIKPVSDPFKGNSIKSLKATLSATRISNTEYRFKVEKLDYTTDVGIKELRWQLPGDSRPYYGMEVVYSAHALEQGKAWNGTAWLTITDKLGNTEEISVKF